MDYELIAADLKLLAAALRSIGIDPERLATILDAAARLLHQLLAVLQLFITLTRG